MKPFRIHLFGRGYTLSVDREAIATGARVAGDVHDLLDGASLEELEELGVDIAALHAEVHLRIERAGGKVPKAPPLPHIVAA